MRLVLCCTQATTECRSATLVRTAISKSNAKLAEPGSVAFQFKHCGQVVVAASVEEDQVCLPHCLHCASEQIIEKWAGP